MMNIEHLVQMANRIGQFFEAYPDRDEALRGIADHIRKFWDPCMRHDLYVHVDGGKADGLIPIVADAIRLHRAELAT